jgi:hypothetical protein
MRFGDLKGNNLLLLRAYSGESSFDVANHDAFLSQLRTRRGHDQAHGDPLLQWSNHGLSQKSRVRNQTIGATLCYQTTNFLHPVAMILRNRADIERSPITVIVALATLAEGTLQVENNVWHTVFSIICLVDLRPVRLSAWANGAIRSFDSTKLGPFGYRCK